MLDELYISCSCQCGASKQMRIITIKIWHTVGVSYDRKFTLRTKVIIVMRRNNMRSQESTRLSAVCCSILICTLSMVGSYQVQLLPSRHSIHSRAVINSPTINMIRSSCDYAVRSSALSMSVMASGAYTNLKNPIALTSDDGVLKEIMISGEGGKVIEVGDIVAAEYSAATIGETKLVFAKGDKEQFIVKDGSTIKGWDIAVTSMKVGEKARFLLRPEYAYGEKGVGDIIPPKSSVEIEIKVLAWLGNQLRPESLFQKDLDIDPFISSTPESIQRDYEDMQVGGGESAHS